MFPHELIAVVREAIPIIGHLQDEPALFFGIHARGKRAALGGMRDIGKPASCSSSSHLGLSPPAGEIMNPCELHG